MKLDRIIRKLLEDLMKKKIPTGTGLVLFGMFGIVLILSFVLTF